MKRRVTLGSSLSEPVMVWVR